MAVLHYNFHSHPKMVGLSNASVGIYARLLSYASANLTDGYVPDIVVRQICDKRRAFACLESAGLLDKCHNGYQIHDYLDYNPSKAKVEKKRAETRARANQRRGGKSQQSNPEQPEDVTANVSDIGKDNYLTSKANVTSTPTVVDGFSGPGSIGAAGADVVSLLDRLAGDATTRAERRTSNG